MKIYAVINSHEYANSAGYTEEAYEILSLHRTEFGAEKALERACNEECDAYMMTFDLED